MFNFCIYFCPKEIPFVFYLEDQEGTDGTRVRWMILEKAKVLKILILSKRETFLILHMSKTL